jgi:hypothetical protein
MDLNFFSYILAPKRLHFLIFKDIFQYQKSNDSFKKQYSKSISLGSQLLFLPYSNSYVPFKNQICPFFVELFWKKRYENSSDPFLISDQSFIKN